MTKILIDEAVVRQAIKGLERSESALHKARAELNQALADAAIDKMKENARELGLSYEQPAQQEPVATLYGSLPVYDKPSQQDIPDLIAGALGVSRGTAYDMMREALAEQPAQEPDPDELTIAYMSGLHEGKKIGAKEGRNKLATWMMQCGFATGHGDTLEDLLDELDTEVEDRLAAKEWVGLTDEEIMSLVPVTGHRPATTFARAIEAKLKEKNT